MTDAVRWLDDRGPTVPAALRERMRDAVAALPVERASGDAIPRALAEAGIACLRAVLRARQGRAVALDLLAADALLTYACEAAAERGPAALDTLVDAHGPTTFAALLAAGSADRAAAEEVR